jgi:Cdc6-like AAA superfamily ATPase
MTRNRRQSSNKPSFIFQAWTANGATILSAMEYLSVSSAQELEEERITIEKIEGVRDSQQAALTYLQNRLGLPTMQTKILTYVMCYNAEHPSRTCDNEDLARFLHLHPLRVMQHMDDINHLEELGYIEIRTSSDSGKVYRITQEANEALIKDEAFNLQSLCLSDNMEFLSRSQIYINEGLRFDRDGNIVKNLERLIKQNPHLSVVKYLNNISNTTDKWFMLLMMTTLAVEGDNFVGTSDLEQILPPHSIRAIIRAINKGVYPFVQNGHVTHYEQDAMAQANQWVLTRKAWLEIFGNENEANSVLSSSDNNERALRRLTPHTSLVRKQLFFSGNTNEQVERLTSLLQEEQYASVCQALQKRGMPTGFCCLFYGAPGTGKTELVQQLAITTQRDLFQVDLSTLRDKFVGESEKQIKEVFDTYRSLVNTQERAPILFFNEADAIFGNRMENTQRSVDKMENAIQNIILQEMESLNGIMICTTNLTTCLDKAFDRRFLFKLEFEKPTNEARKQIWQSMLEGLNDEQATYLADHFDFSGGQIQNISRKQVINAIFAGKDDIDYEQIKIDCQNEKISRNNGRRIGF